jgi:outer membrane protein insertion porin family
LRLSRHLQIHILLALMAAGPGVCFAWDQGPPNPASSQQNPPASDQQPLPSGNGFSAYQGLVVQSIEFPDLAYVDPEQLRRQIPQKVGRPFDRDLVRQSIQLLHSTGRFADIRVEAERTPEGRVSLVFVTRPNYFIGEVEVEGAPAPPAANQVVNASKLQLGEPFTREKLDRALKNIEQLMQQNGYYHSTVREEERSHPETQLVSIQLRVTPGPLARVGRVLITGTPGYSQGQVQDIAKMHSGDPVSVQRLSRALDRLRKKYQKQNRLLAQVAISSRTYRRETNTLDYTFDIQPGPKVDIVAEGFKIGRGVLKRNVPVYEENALDDDLLNEGRRNLLNYLQGRGFFDASISLKKISSPSDELRVIYIIDAGPRHILAKLDISGNKYFREDRLRAGMQVQQAGRLFSHGRYSQGLLSQDVRELEIMYRDNGFEQAKISTTIQDNYEGRANQLAVSLHVEEGPQTLVSALHIEGNQRISADNFPSLNIQPGQPFSQTNIASDRDIILNYYLNNGFPNAAFEAAANPAPEPNRMDVTYTVHEGEQVFVDKVIISGLNYTRPFVVRREIQTKSGDPLSQLDMLKTQQRLYDLGIFSQVDTAVENPEGGEQQKNVLVDVQEAKRYTFNYGLGLEFQPGLPAVGTNQPQGETGVSPRVSLGVTRLNFRGRNHTVTFKGNVGRLQQRGLVSYDAPRWFNSQDWRLTFTTFYDNTVDVTTFTSRRLEGSVQAEQIVSRKRDGSPITILDYRLTYRRVQAFDLSKTISPNQIPLLSLPTRVGIPGFSFIRNKRDNDLETTKGSYNTIDGGVADSHFASETDFSRILIQNSTYHSFGRYRGKRFVFARSTRVGVQTPFGNTFMPQPGQQCPESGQPVCLPLAERFFSGGGNSHRGFGLNQAGPRDPITGFPLGGTALFINNLELRIPPPTLPFFQDNLTFAFFHDAGNVFTRGNDMLHNLLRWNQKHPELCLQSGTASQCDYSYISHAIGVGVRYKTPVGPVRFDFGYNLNPPAFPSCENTPGNPTVSASCPAASPDFVPQHASHFNVFFSIGQTF